MPLFSAASTISSHRFATSRSSVPNATFLFVTIARATRLARANTYGALEGLVTRGAASKTPPPSRPARYRPVDPQALIAQLAASQGAALDRLDRALQDAAQPLEPATREVVGARAVANLLQQL